MSIQTKESQTPGVKYKAVLSNRIYLSRTKALHDKLVEELTYILPPDRPGGIPETMCDVTRVNNNIVTIPIGRSDLIPDDYEIVDKRTVSPAMFPIFRFTLRDTQLEVFDNVEESCIINANPSWGKCFALLVGNY